MKRGEITQNSSECLRSESKSSMMAVLLSIVSLNGIVDEH